MPWEIEERDGKFCVVKEGGEVEKCHDARADAEAQLKALYASKDEKSFMSLQQTEVQYTPLSATPGQACANCRWFQSFGDEYTLHARCHLVSDYPEAIEPTGHCQRWELGKYEPMAMTPMPVVIVQSEADVTAEAAAEIKAAQKQQRTLMQRLLVLFGRDKQKAEQTAFKVSANDWMITWSNNFQDRDGEIFTEKAIDDYVWRVDMGIVPPPDLWVWHSGAKTKIGKAAWVGRHGHFLVAAGVFDETAQAQAAKAFYAKNAHKTGISHGFTFPADQFDGKHYHAFNTFEISTLPRGAEANLFTSLEGVKDMALTESKREYLEKVFGAEHAAMILQQLDTRGKALEQIDVAFKDYSASPGAQPVTDAVKAVEADVKALVMDIIADNADGATKLAEAGKAFTAHDERIKALEAAVAALKDQLDARPRTAAHDADTVIANEQVVADVQKQFAKTHEFWGTTVTETGKQ